MEKKLFLLDALALIYRAYYALIRNPRITSKGINTNAQFGFTSTLFDLINKEKPTHLAVCFDTHAPTERHTDFTDYKANRQEAPEDLLASIPDIQRIIRGFNIPVVELDGYEADDIIGTVAWHAADVGYEVYMVTPDKDYGQLLVKPHVYIYKPPAYGNAEEILNAEKICTKWDIAKVEQVVDMLGLMGDAVDNIPGIPGVGEKTAAKLLKEYHTLEGVLENADKIKGALGEKVRAGKESAIISKKLATIITNVPVEFHEEDYRLKDWNREELNAVFTELEFKTLGKRILGETFNAFQSAPQGVQTDLFGNAVEQKLVTVKETIEEETNPNNYGLVADKNIENTKHQYLLIESEEAIKELVAELLTKQEICFDTETTGIDANNVEIVGLSFSYEKHKGYYIPFGNKQKETTERLKLFIPLFNDPNKCWVGQNIKYDLLVLKWYGIEPKGELFDTMLAHYVIEPEGRRSMDLLSAQYLGYEPVSIETLIGKKGKNQGNMRDVELDKIKEYAAEDADITLQLKECFVPLLKAKEVERVFYEVENPLVRVLTEMEFEGIKVDEGFLHEYSRELEIEAKKCEESVYAQAGVRFNLASPKQLGEVLFDKLQLDPKAKKTKTGQYATGEDVLLKLANQHKIVDDILGFRELTKLKSTYIDALPEMINKKTGRVHTSYAQAVAVTGRLSSNNPNLQNIPIRTARGREIRKAFVPREPGRILMSADYSQIELRIVAAISGDPNMCAAFKERKDIHTATAAKVYGVEESAVTKEMRYKAKSVNFGIIYGQGAFGLAENLGVSRAEAKEIIENYKKEFPFIQQYMDDQIKFAKEHDYVQTLMGRKRWLKDIHSANFTVRGFAERNAINSPIQGTAADMIKLAMIKIHAEMKKSAWESKMILQVHDELVFDAVESEADALQNLIINCMVNALPLPNGVPVEAEVGKGKNWLEAH
ncbi:MAG: DNA polymerase I [Sphingobacteriia bacterium 24-36-13]|jgi:DNA polymerase-1|uniref:DNA polymerase I n=1 Tax=Sediminibacterium sp. TaxID=1917865 RepID=UPI000BDB70A5|nr:DNA polymerase I [Sediminibacterium sp.]OYY07829.1 MAG: DNA polymerase I [Sphingobacteriia bacterium 35-36-14]OYZ53167.1 MAG: DNA polymerase I [Sphingobacteriia bacterium 24-36-13]OZA63086.1 MAG: DNA polymerase I [Sphingobacteriia bacterium 39-36-14]HQS25244.1 DNA polymerase I [Sediminibacterium sp.]HQS36206.1 DNA polymerase I [Sediminibacterium sp.]